MTDISAFREFYEHDGSCPGTNFTPLNAHGCKTCLDCAGIFDKDGKGVAVTSKRFDENWVEPPPKTKD